MFVRSVFINSFLSTEKQYQRAIWIQVSFKTEMGTLSSGGSLRSPQKKKLLTPYDKNFEQCLIDSGMPRRSERANLENWQELNTRLARRRPSLSETGFSEEDFRNFQLYSDNARNETEVISNLLPIFRGNSAVRPCQERVFKNLTRLNSKIATARSRKISIFVCGMISGIIFCLPRGQTLFCFRISSWK